MTGHAARIAVVVLNTNRRDDTLECLRSLDASTYPHVDVIVLDNASTDGSVEAIRARHPAVDVVPLTENRGYAGNNNVGIRYALEKGADWVLVLNEDTTMREDCLAELVAVGEARPDAGLLGPLVYHHDEPRVIQSAGGVLAPADWASVHVGANEDDQGQYAEVREVEWISGCALMVRRAVVEQVGGIDERFFYYWEETEWCVRARRAGWRAFVVPRAKLWHKGVRRDYRPGPDVAYYNARNRMLLMALHGAPVAVRARAVGTMTRTLVSMSLRPKWRGARPHRDALWQGMVDYWRGQYGRRPT